MKLREFRKIARQQFARATVISDGCRDYVVAVDQVAAPGILTDRRGNPLRFPSLAAAKHAVRDATEIVLAVRIAADEACAGSSVRDEQFSTIPLVSRAA